MMHPPFSLSPSTVSSVHGRNVISNWHSTAFAYCRKVAERMSILTSAALKTGYCRETAMSQDIILTVDYHDENGVTRRRDEET